VNLVNPSETNKSNKVRPQTWAAPGKSSSRRAPPPPRGLQTSSSFASSSSSLTSRPPAQPEHSPSEAVDHKMETQFHLCNMHYDWTCVSNHALFPSVRAH